MTEIIHQKDSHKGQNGNVLIISGSKDFYGATVLCGLACLKSGVDLVYPYTPEVNRTIVASYSPEFVIKTFTTNEFSGESIQQIMPIMNQMDAILIGPGLKKSKNVLLSVRNLLRDVKVPVVIDADAIYALNHEVSLPDNSVITPHSVEYSALSIDMRTDDISTISGLLNATIVLKGQADYVVFGEKYYRNDTGNESMTKGGTGDILSGLIVGFLAQGVSGFEASKKATTILGEAGDKIYTEKQYYYRASELLEYLEF